MSQDDLDQVGHALNTVANVGLQISTGGLVGLNGNGQLEKGYSGHALDESIGEITGRNQARKANMDAKDALAEQKAAKKTQIDTQNTQNAQKDVQASNYAASVRATAAQQKAQSLGSSGSNPAQDFLGL